MCRPGAHRSKRGLQQRPGRGGRLQRREVLAGPRRFEGDAGSLEPGEHAAQRPDGLLRPAGLGVGEPLGPVAGGCEQCVSRNPGPCQGQELADRRPVLQCHQRLEQRQRMLWTVQLRLLGLVDRELPCCLGIPAGGGEERLPGAGAVRSCMGSPTMAASRRARSSSPRCASTVAPITGPSRTNWQMTAGSWSKAATCSSAVGRSSRQRPRWYSAAISGQVASMSWCGLASTESAWLRRARSSPSSKRDVSVMPAPTPQCVRWQLELSSCRHAAELSRRTIAEPG